MPIKKDLLDLDQKPLRSGAMGPIDNLLDQTPLEDNDSDYKSGKA
jgi:hypothetical protein